MEIFHTSASSLLQAYKAFCATFYATFYQTNFVSSNRLPFTELWRHVELKTYVEHKAHLYSSPGCHLDDLQRNRQSRISAFACKSEHILSDIHWASKPDPWRFSAWAFAIARQPEKRSCRTQRTPRGCRTQTCIVRHSQSVPFVIDEAFSDSQTRKKYLLLQPSQCWNRLRDKHHCVLLNHRRVDPTTCDWDENREKKGFFHLLSRTWVRLGMDFILSRPFSHLHHCSEPASAGSISMCCPRPTVHVAGTRG